MKTKEQVSPDIEKLCAEASQKEPLHNLVLLNDEDHTLGQVTKQLVKALKCSSARAFGFMKDAHTNGSAVVLSDTKEECNKAKKILEEIALGTRIDKL